MNVPVLRKTIRLPNLARTTVAVRSVVPLNKRRVDLPTARRSRQCRLDLLVRAEHRSIVDFCYTAFLSGLTDRCIDQLLFRTITRTFRSASFSSTPWQSFFAKRLQKSLFVRFVFIARYQPRRLTIQAFRRFLHQQFRVFFRSLSIDHFQHEFVFGIKGNVIPVVAASGISGIIFVAVFLLFPNEVPLLVELNFLGIWGKNSPTLRGFVRRVLPPISYNDLRSRDRLSVNDPFFAFRILRQCVRGWQRWFFLANANRTKPFHVARKNAFCKSGTGANGCRLLRKHPERGYFFHHEHRV